MATTPTKSRASELRSLGRRIVTAADVAAPAVDSGFDVTSWDQVLLVVTGNAAGIAELMLYMQYRSALAALERTAMYPALHIPEVALVNHTLSQTPAVYVINTMFADRIFPSVVSFSTATSVYLNVIGVTPEGGALLDALSPSFSGDAGDVNVAEWGGTTVLNGGTAGSPAVGGVVAHDAAASGAKPVIVGAKATDAEPGAVTEADAAYLSTTLAGRLRVNAVGNVDDGSAAALAPVRVAGTADAALSVVDDGDVAQLVTDLYRRLQTLPQGATVDDAADTAALNPLKVGGIAISHLAPDAAQVGDMVHATTDLYRRLRTLPEGPIADGAVVDATNPVKTGGVAYTTTTLAASDVDAGDVAHLALDLEHRLFTHPMGGTADNAANDALDYPLKVGAVAENEPIAAGVVTDADFVHLTTDLYRRLWTHPVGAVADDVASVATEYPVKIGAVVDQVVAAATDADMVHLVTDLYRRLRVVSAAYDDVAAADRVSANTTADDRDESAQVWANETLAAADAVYYPSSSGYEIGNRPWLTIQIGIRDGTLTFQSSNEGTNWTDVTKMVVDRGQGGGGYASWISPDVATVYYQLEVTCGARYFRALWTPADATSIVIINAMTRAL
ncbi:MAG: hypothetical protein WC683_18170 [bacterium]